LGGQARQLILVDINPIRVMPVQPRESQFLRMSRGQAECQGDKDVKGTGTLTPWENQRSPRRGNWIKPKYGL